MESGLGSVLSVIVSTSDYLSAWFDENQDGDFDDALILEQRAVVMSIDVEFGLDVSFSALTSLYTCLICLMTH